MIKGNSWVVKSGDNVHRKWCLRDGVDRPEREHVGLRGTDQRRELQSSCVQVEGERGRKMKGKRDRVPSPSTLRWS